MWEQFNYGGIQMNQDKEQDTPFDNPQNTPQDQSQWQYKIYELCSVLWD